MSALPSDRIVAFGPGRVNLIGEHTDYNDGLALPFAIDRGVTVTAQAGDGDLVTVEARDLGERDEFRLGETTTTEGWTSSLVSSATTWRSRRRGIRPKTSATARITTA